MRKMLVVIGAVFASLMLTATAALAEVNTNATALATSVADDVQDTVLAAIPIVLAAVLAVGLALWAIRFVLRRFGVRTSG